MVVLVSIAALSACQRETSEPSAPISAADVPKADRVFSNGHILTVDQDFSIAESIAITGERILAIGSDAEMSQLIDDETDVVDLQGQTVVPGLIDNHMHFVRATRDWYRHVRWDGIKSRRQALTLVAERAAILPDGDWVVVLGGWNFSQFADDSSIFTRNELDALFSTVPVYIQQNYRRGFANSAALAAAGINANTVYEGAGQLVRDANGEPTGEFVGTEAMAFITRHMPEVTPQVWDASLQQTVASLNRMGLTTVYDVGGNSVTPGHYGALHRAHDSGKLNMRVFYTINGQNQELGSAQNIIATLRSHTPDNVGLNLIRRRFIPLPNAVFVRRADRGPARCGKRSRNRRSQGRRGVSPSAVQKLSAMLGQGLAASNLPWIIKGDATLF